MTAVQQCGYTPILRLLLVLRILVTMKWYSLPLLQSFVMLIILVLWMLLRSLDHLSQSLHEAQLDLCTSGILIPIPRFFFWVDSSPSTMQSGLDLCASRITSFSLFTFSSFQAWIVSSLSHSFSMLLFRPEFSLLSVQEWIRVPNFNGTWNCVPCPRCGLRDLCEESVPLVVLWIHDTPLHMRTLSLELCWVIQANTNFQKAKLAWVFSSCTAWPLPYALPTFFLHFWSSLQILRLTGKN